jgi:hypothetical protein
MTAQAIAVPKAHRRPMAAQLRWRVMTKTAWLVMFLAAGAAAAQAPERFSATASVKAPKGSVAVPVEIRIDRYASDAERDKLVETVKANDAAKTRGALEALGDVGTITVAARQTPIKYAYARPTGGGSRLVTLVTAKPIAFVGAGLPDAKAKSGHELALAFLILDAAGKGDGEIALAANVKVTPEGALQTSDYGKETVRLTGIGRKQ